MTPPNLQPGDAFVWGLMAFAILVLLLQTYRAVVTF